MAATASVMEGDDDEDDGRFQERKIGEGGGGIGTGKVYWQEPWERCIDTGRGVLALGEVYWHWESILQQKVTTLMAVDGREMESRYVFSEHFDCTWY